MFNKKIINEYKKNLDFCTNFWLNDNHGHSGSLLNLDDVSKIEKDDVWNNIFITYKSDLKSTQKFRNILKELITALLHKDLKCKAPLIEPNLRRNLGKWST
ncbi:hypothetical protein ACBB12_00005 [Acinetobacter baumannii]